MGDLIRGGCRGVDALGNFLHLLGGELGGHPDDGLPHVVQRQVDGVDPLVMLPHGGGARRIHGGSVLGVVKDW